MKTLLFLAVFIPLFSSAQDNNEDSLKQVQTVFMYSMLEKSLPVMGYRFIITGDFDGDNKTDTLVERFTDSTFQEEVAKYYTNCEYGDVIMLNFLLERKSFLTWENDNKPNLSGGEMGFHYVENCGDLNFDGTDELLVVKQNADYSNLNRVYVYTFKKGKWQELYQIPIWEWQFPPTPSTTMRPSLFGNFDFVVIGGEEYDEIIEKQLKEFRFFTRYDDNTVEYEGRNPLFDELPDNFEEIGEVEYLKKHFRQKSINDSVYLQDIKNPAFFYKSTQYMEDGKSTNLLFIDDGAGMMTIRVGLKQSRSPFKMK